MRGETWTLDPQRRSSAAPVRPPRSARLLRRPFRAAHPRAARRASRPELAGGTRRSAREWVRAPPRSNQKDRRDTPREVLQAVPPPRSHPLQKRGVAARSRRVHPRGCGGVVPERSAPQAARAVKDAQDVRAARNAQAARTVQDARSVQASRARLRRQRFARSPRWLPRYAAGRGRHDGRDAAGESKAPRSLPSRDRAASLTPRRPRPLRPPPPPPWDVVRAPPVPDARAAGARLAAAPRARCAESARGRRDRPA